MHPDTLWKQQFHCSGQFYSQSLPFEQTTLICPAVAKLVHKCLGRRRHVSPHRPSRIKHIHIPGYIAAVAKTLCENPAGQLPRIVKLLYAPILEFFGGPLGSLKGVAVHHGNPYHQHIEICVRKSLQDSMAYRTGTLILSLGSGGREQCNEAAVFQAAVECFHQRLKRFL